MHITTLAAGLALGLSAGAVAAAEIAWSLGPTFGGADGHEGILTDGTVVAAMDLGPSDGGSPLVVDPGGLNLAFTKVRLPVFNAHFADTTYSAVSDIGDAGWRAIIDTASYGSTGDVSAPSFLTGLTPGRSYQVQFFSGRAYPGLDARRLRFGDGLGHWSPEVSMGANVFVSVLGSFVADAATQRIDFDENTNLPTLNAYVLREISPVPEPGAWAMALAGLGVLASRTGRRRRA